MFWPDKARIAVTTSLMFEAGPQNLRRALGPIPVAQEGDFPDLPTNSWFDYAANEGIPRALDLFDRHGAKASSFVTGMSVERYPHVALEIVKRGGTRPPRTDASGHPRSTWHAMRRRRLSPMASPESNASPASVPSAGMPMPCELH